jgi:hypothetical protein
MHGSGSKAFSRADASAPDSWSGSVVAQVSDLRKAFSAPSRYRLKLGVATPMTNI